MKNYVVVYMSHCKEYVYKCEARSRKKARKSCKESIPGVNDRCILEVYER